MRKQTVTEVIRIDKSDPMVYITLDNGHTIRFMVGETTPGIGENIAVEYSWGEDYTAPVIPLGTPKRFMGRRLAPAL